MQIFKQNQQDSNRIFKAKLGKNITQTLRKEFEYNPVKLQKYEQLFQDTFKKNIDENTIRILLILFENLHNNLVNVAK